MVGAVDALPGFPEPREEHLESPPIRRYAGGVDETEVDTAVTDLRHVPLRAMPALAPVTLQRAVRRVLPDADRPVETVKLPRFSSGI